MSRVAAWASNSRPIRANATCAACHDKIDPLGIALERYGRLVAFGKAIETVPHSLPGENADGTELDGYTALKAYLYDRQDDVVAHLS